MAEMIVEKEQVEGRNVSMYPRDWATVHQVSKDLGLNSMSAGLRRIVQEWKRLKFLEEAMLQYLRLENACRAGIITQDEFMAALGLVNVMLEQGGDGRDGDD